MISQAHLELEKYQDRIKTPMCSICRKVVDRIERIALNAHSMTYHFKVYCHGAEEPLELSYEAIRSMSSIVMIQPVVFGEKLPKHELKLKERTTIKESEEKQQIRRLLNFDGIK